MIESIGDGGWKLWRSRHWLRASAVLFVLLCWHSRARCTKTSRPTILVELDANHLRSFPSAFYGVNAGHLRNAIDWKSDSLQHAMRQLGFAQVFRIPAGELANYWDWRTGRLLLDYDDGFNEASNRYPSSLGEMMREAALLHAVPLLVLNMLSNPECIPLRGRYCRFTKASPNLNYQLRLLSEARKEGYDIKYLELGNEYYLGGQPGYTAVYPDSSSDSEPLPSVLYGRLATSWIHAIKRRYPNAKVAVVGSHISGSSKQPKRQADWLSGLFCAADNSHTVGGNNKPAVEGEDAVTLHIYPHTGLAPGTKVNAKTAEDMLGTPFRTWRDIEDNDLKVIPPNVSVWFTEYNLSDHAVPASGTWAHGLFMATMSLLFLEDDRVQMAIHHDLVDSAAYGDLYSSTNAYAGSASGAFPKSLPATALYGESATADALEMIGDAVQGANEAEELAFRATPVISVGRTTFSYPALYGWEFCGPRLCNLAIMNLGNRQLTVDLEDVTPEGIYKALKGDPGTHITGGLKGSPSNLICVQGRLGRGAGLVVPPFSITVVTAGHHRDPSHNVRMGIRMEK